MVTLPVTSPYTAKDQQKADIATKFIGRGSPRSSTAAYAQAFGELANCGKYTQDDWVFVSVEGARKGRLSLDTDELERAARARVTFVTDTPFHRNRLYNIGEREAAIAIASWGYTETKPGIWKPRTT